MDLTMSEPFISKELLELVRVASGAHYVELVLHDHDGDRYVDLWCSHGERLDLGTGTAADPEAGAGTVSTVPSFRAPLTGPSAEKGWIAAARSDDAPLDEDAIEILNRAARLVEEGLDRRVERIRLDEMSELLRSNQHSLQETRDQLEVSNRELEQFAYIAAHELVAPLRAVAVYAELLETVTPAIAEADSGALDCVHEIRAGVQRMTRQVQYLLQLSQTQLDAEATEPIAVEAVVHAAIDSVETALDEVGAVVTVDALPTVMASAVPLQSVFANLLTNAIRYRNTEAPLRIEVTSFSESDGQCVEFSDNGVGVASEDQSRIFEMFERASTAEDGSGIGLALSRKILEVFGATIRVMPGAEAGSIFRMKFPHVGLSPAG